MFSLPHSLPPQIRLLTLPTLSPAPGLKPLLQGPGETVCALRMVYLRDVTTDNVLPFLAVGTATMLGESTRAVRP
jgi:hypothetical protein